MRKMGRALNAGILLGAFLAVWVGAMRLDLDDGHAQIVETLPLWILVAFGAYSLASIALALISFNDCQAAVEELDEDIKKARADLAGRKGFTF